MTETVVTLPFPVTTNSLYCNAKYNGRAKTVRYQEWCNVAGWDLNRQKVEPVPGNVIIDMAVGRPLNQDGSVNKRKRDITNLIKGAEDLLVEHGIIEDDSLVDDCRIHWLEGIKGMRIIIRRAE